MVSSRKGSFFMADIKSVLKKAKRAKIVKEARKGHDFGKKGKNFDKVADKAAKEYGSKEAGDKVAGKIFWNMHKGWIMSKIQSCLKTAKKYHGDIPPTKEDAKIGMSHLVRTEDLVDDKIDEHDNAFRKALKLGHKPSAKYHKSHLKKHEAEKKEIEQSKKTLRAVRGSLPTLGGAIWKESQIA